MGTLLAVAAGLVAAIASWLILRSGERDRARLERALGIAAPRPTRRSRATPAQLFDSIGRLAPAGLVVSLGGDSTAMTPALRRRAHAIVVLLALAVLGLVFLSPFWFVALIVVPRLARAIVEARARADAVGARRALDREVTAAIDVFVLALEAGLPFERALAAYSESVDSELGRELASTVRELEVGYRRREALERLVSRTRSATLAALASAVRIAEDFGTPIAQALRSLALEVRAQRRQRLQETALRAPVTMLLPTAGFILLPIFAIVLGPIALRVAHGTLF